MTKLFSVLVALSAALPAFADFSCVERFKSANDTYFEQARKLQLQVGTGIGVSAGGVGAWALCLKTTHSFTGCSTFFALPVAVGSAYSWERHGRVAALESAYVLYQVYLGDEESLLSFASAVGGSEAQAVRTELAVAMESGMLCMGRRLATIDEAIAIVRANLSLAHTN